MAEYFQMDNYGLYIWTSYAAFFIGLLSLTGYIFYDQYQQKKRLHHLLDSENRLKNDEKI